VPVPVPAYRAGVLSGRRWTLERRCRTGSGIGRDVAARWSGLSRQRFRHSQHLPETAIQRFRESAHVAASEGAHPAGGLPGTRTFFTNAVMGLRSADGSKALDTRAWQAEPAFAAFCREFLLYQIEILQPRLLVVPGPNARSSLESAQVAAAVHYSSHPYGDFNFTEARKADDALALRHAWERSGEDKIFSYS